MSSMQVAVPAGVSGGAAMQVDTPSGPMQVTVPPGLKPGDQFIVQMPALPVANAVPVVATATPIQPVQPVPPVQQGRGGRGLWQSAPPAQGGASIDVPAAIRSKQMVLAREAEAYCATLTPEQAHASKYTGCRVVTCREGCCCPGVPCGVTYACNPCDQCLCFPLTCVWLPFPMINPLFCLCSGERFYNQWITRGKHGEKTGAWVIVDEENKTIAAYGVKCCSTQLQDKPQCYCEKL